MTPYQIKYARAAVVAKVAYWDALRAFEVSTTDGHGDWSDRTSDKVGDALDNLAACAGDTAEDIESLTDADIAAAFPFLN